jgi:Cdc6-like AAA superfamily ATPase
MTSDLPPLEPEDLQINMQNTVKLLESADTENIYQVALLLGEPGSGKSQWIKRILDTLITQDPNRAIYIVGPTVKQYSAIATDYGDIPIVTRYQSLTPHISSLRAATDAICIYDDLNKEDSKLLAELLETARNSRNTIFHLVHHLEYIPNSSFSLYNLYCIFKTSHALVFSRLWKHILNSYGEKADVQRFYNRIKREQFSKFIVNRSQPHLPYFILDAQDNMDVDEASEFQSG